MSSLIASVVLFSFFSLVVSQTGPTNWTASPFNPPALPLAVRSPYLNVWMAQGNNPKPAFIADNQPWWMESPVQWYASVVVDSHEYRLLSPWAAGELTPNQTAVEFTATRTSFLFSADGVQFNMSFLSPIEPKNFTLQSLPYAYLYITAEPIDGQQHRVRMYSDIEGYLAAGDFTQVVEWTSEDSTDYVVLGIKLQNQIPFVEKSILSQDATVYYSYKKIAGTTTSWTIAGMNQARGTFFANPSGGQLSNQAETDFRAPASGNDSPCFGVSVDWGNITSKTEPAVWALGVYRNPSIQHLTPEGSFENRSPYFVSAINDPVAATKFVLDDFPRALSAAEALDTQIRADGEAFSPEYADLLALSARQAMGTMDITIPPENNGSWNTSDVKIFMKNIGSVGSDNETIASVNNVDALYAAFPAFLYLNPDIGRYLLAPLLEYQDSSAYKLPYAAKNIGSAYPSATANNISDPHTYGVDETASMVILTLAYSMASGDGSLIMKHYGLLSDWAEYLGNNTITPFNQSSGDFSVNSDFLQANQTNLALKGIIAIAAMAKIADAAGNEDDQTRFNETATSAIQLWQAEALSPSHANFVYGASDTSGLMYNLYADKLLRLGLVPDSVYTLLTTYYQNAAGQATYGIPLNNSPSQNTTTNWMMFAASTTTSNATRDFLVSQVHSYASNNLNSVPFTSIYDPNTGIGGPGTSAGIASPAQGGIFALLALGTTSKTISITSNATPPVGNSSSRSKKPNAGVIAGAAVAGVIVACCIVAGMAFVVRRRRLRKNGVATPGQLPPTHTEPYVLSPSTSEAYSYSGLTGSSALLSSGTSYSTPSRSEDLTRGVIQDRAEGGRRDSKRREAGMSASIPESVSLLASTGRHQSQEERSVNNGTVNTQGVAMLRSEFDTLRREVERMRQERLAAEEAPPLYSDPI